jgi:hypothetical protein
MFEDNEKIVDIFPIKIYEAEFPNFQDVKQQLIQDLEPYFSSLAPGNEYIDSNGNPLIYRTLPNLQDDIKFKPLVDFVEYHGKKYWKELNLTSRVEPYVLHMWSNKIPPGGFTPVHVHTPIHIGTHIYIYNYDYMYNYMYTKSYMHICIYTHTIYIYIHNIRICMYAHYIHIHLYVGVLRRVCC